MSRSKKGAIDRSLKALDSLFLSPSQTIVNISRFVRHLVKSLFYPLYISGLQVIKNCRQIKKAFKIIIVMRNRSS